MRLRVSQLLKLFFAQSRIRREDSFPLHILQLRHPFANVVAIGIVALSLADRIEDGITRLPALRVVAEVPVDQRLGEVPLAAAVIE